MTRVVLAAVAALMVAGTAFGWGVEEAFRLRRTDRRWLRAGPPRRAYRRWRAFCGSYALWWWSWPHLFDVLLGSRRVAVATIPRVDLWWRGTATLARLGTWRAAGEPVVLVHSVVTRPWILDLLPERSLAGALIGAGHDVYLFDWGDPGRAQAGLGLDGHVRLLAEAVNVAAARSPTGRVHLVGYCMGATVAFASVGAWGPGPVASLTLIAPPFDAEVPGGMAAFLTRPELTPVLALDGDGCVPAAFVREGFHLLRRKAVRYAWGRLRRRRDRDFQRVASALSRWAWEQRRLPGALWFDLVDLFRGNALLRGTLRVEGHPVRAANVTIPTLVLVTDRDHIVPIASSLALTRQVPHAEVVRCPAGHVSMLMGHESRMVLVPALDAFLRRASAGDDDLDPPGPVRRAARRAHVAAPRVRRR
ncbi:MAG: poly[(R)-3-hydroxyalkanoate] polymerase subunit PhaC [Frankiaceae bacterium]|nr:poly[(R)-3-hydroxyalkanoate] polymerase subunit PhaC [Frankiaceae bacterium]